MDLEKFDRLVENANTRLGNANIKVSIERANRRLYLRATFPPKPNSGKSAPWQQRLSIAQANPDGLKDAESTAKIISGQLDLGTFKWSDYIDPPNPVDRAGARTIGDWIEELERYYFSEKERTATTLETWNHEYLQPLGKLPDDGQLTEDWLRRKLFDLTEPNTRTRRRYALAFAKLADLAGLDHRLRDLVGNYSTKAVSPRSLPSDETIAEIYTTIDDPLWRWVFGTMAAYGIRNHEAFFLDFEDYPTAYVGRGKTDERFVKPLYPEWPDRWELRKIPAIDFHCKTHSQYGNRVTKAFEDLDLPFAPYNLRHSYARRGFEFGMSAFEAAWYMGHSHDLHCKIYRHWVERSSFDRSYQRLIDHPDRPLPP